MLDPETNRPREEERGQLTGMDQVANELRAAVNDPRDGTDGVVAGRLSEPGAIRFRPGAYQTQRLIRGQRALDGHGAVSVHRNPEASGTALPPRYRNVSERYDWGADASIVDSLALAEAILRYCSGRQVARRLARQLVVEIILWLPPAGFELSVAAVRRWVNDKLEPQRELLIKGFQAVL